MLGNQFRDNYLIQQIKVDDNEQVLNLSELVQQLKIMLTIIRNLILLKENENYLIGQNKLVQIIFNLFLENNNYEINILSMEILSVLSKQITLDENNSEHIRFFNKLVQMLNSESQEENEQGIENLHHLMMNQENENMIESALPVFVDKLNKLLLSNSYDVVERVLEIICHFSDLKISTRLLFSKQDEFFARLIALIAGHSVKYRKIAKISAIIIKNVSVTPAARIYLKPYEFDLFMIASSDEVVSDLISNVLNQIKTAQIDFDQQQIQFYSNLRKEIDALNQLYKQYQHNSFYSKQLIINQFYQIYNHFDDELKGFKNIRIM